MTSALKRPSSPSPIVLPISSTVPGSNAFILLWNSRQATPSPTSQSEALPFFASGFERRFTSASSSTPSGRGTAW